MTTAIIALTTVVAVYVLIVFAVGVYVFSGKAMASVFMVLAAASLMTCSKPASAQQTTMGVHLYSVHAPAKDYQNNENPGLYIRTAEGWTAGVYRNTLRRTSVYAGYTVDYAPFSLTVGAISGYQRKYERVVAGPNGECDNGTGFRYCTQQTGATRGAITLLLAPSVALPPVLGAVPRVSYVPGLAGAANVFHLSLERKL